MFRILENMTYFTEIFGSDFHIKLIGNSEDSYAAEMYLRKTLFEGCGQSPTDYLP